MIFDIQEILQGDVSFVISIKMYRDVNFSECDVINFNIFCLESATDWPTGIWENFRWSIPSRGPFSAKLDQKVLNISYVERKKLKEFIIIPKI